MTVAISAPLAAFAQRFRWPDAPAETRRVLQLSLLDFCAVALAGCDEPVSRITRRMVGQDGGAPEASVIGGGPKLPARAAALANGTTAHALDYDDTHFLHIGHLAVVMFPAALAMAQRQGTGGRGFLAAALVGYEAAARIGDWLGRAHYEAGFHQTATAGAFGAALAAGRLLGLDAGRLEHVLGLTASRAAGLKNQFGTMGKPGNAGVAAAIGVEVARLVAGGYVSNPAGLEGFGASHAGAGNDAALVGLGHDFVLGEVSHKFHACCHGTHAALEALTQLRAAGLRADAVAEVVIFVHPRWLNVCDQRAPQTGLEAKFSYRLSAAMLLAGRDTGALASFSDAACGDRALIALRDKVRVRGDASLADSAARVVVARVRGANMRCEHDLRAPVGLAVREARLRRKAAVLVGENRADQLWRAVRDLAAEGEIAPLAALLGRQSGS